MIPMLIVKAVLGGLWKRLTALFGWVASNPAKAALIAALIALWWQHGTLSGVRRDLTAAIAAKDAEKAAHRKTVEGYREASKLAQEAAEAKKRATEAEHKRIANHADENYDALRSQYRALLVRFSAKADSRSSNGIGLPERPGAPILPENSAHPSELLISQSDALKCADLGAYAVGAYRWAEDVSKTANSP